MTVLEALPSRTTRVTAQARQWRLAPALLAVARGLLSLVAWLLVGVGRLAYWTVAGVWLVLTWMAAAVKVGWDDARAGRGEAAG